MTSTDPYLSLDELLEVVELLVFVADLFECAPKQVDEALDAFVGEGGLTAAELAADALRVADRVAAALGFAGARVELPR
jgi:hypothetical protein